MEESKNLEQNLDKSNEKLHISDVSVEFCICGNETGSRFYDNEKGTIECVDCGKQIQNYH